MARSAAELLMARRVAGNYRTMADLLVAYLGEREVAAAIAEGAV